jgi:ubiquinone/menaquinone biosynthesis C-methylase UbiE
MRALSSRTITGLERTAYRAYVSLDPVRQLEIRPVVDRLDIQPGERVLDLGTGRGFWANQAARAGADVLACDVRQDALERAAVRFPDVHFVHTDAAETGLEDESFDVVLLLSVLEHTENPEKVMGEVARVLRPGGRLGLTTDTFDDARWRPSRTRHAARWHVRHFFERNEVTQLLADHGFRVTWSRAIFGFRGAPQLLRLRFQGNQLHWILAPAVWVLGSVAGDTNTGALLSITALKD